MNITLKSDMTAEQLCSTLKKFLSDKYGDDVKFKDINIHIEDSSSENDLEEWYLCEDKFINLREDKQEEFISMVYAHILNKYNLVNHRIAFLTNELTIHQKKIAESQDVENPRKGTINNLKIRIDTIEKELGASCII